MRTKIKLLISSLISISYLVIGSAIDKFLQSTDIIFNRNYDGAIFQNIYFRMASHYLYFNSSKLIRKFSNVFFIKHEYIGMLALIGSGYILITSMKKESYM